jgi:hypothetical protein
MSASPAAPQNGTQAEILRPVLVGADIGDEGRGGRVAGAADAGQHPADEQDRIRPGHRADQIVDGEGQHRGQQDRTAPEAVAEIADQRREQELHGRIDEEQPATLDRRFADTNAGQLLQIGRQHRHDDADAGNIEQQRGENKRKPPPGGFGFDHDDIDSWSRLGAKAEELVIGESAAQNNKRTRQEFCS